MTLRPKVFKKDGNQRYGRGFSREELKKAGLSLREALRLGISIDSKRKTAHDVNAEAVRVFLEGKRTGAKAKRKSKS